MMGEALRAGGLYRGVDGVWHDANGHPVAGPSAEERQRVEEREDALWAQDEQMQAAGTQRLVIREATARERPAAREQDDFEPDPAALFSTPTYAPAGEPDDLDLTGDEQAEIDAIHAKAQLRLQAEREESEKALAARREEARREGLSDTQRSMSMADKSKTGSTGTPSTSTPATSGTGKPTQGGQSGQGIPASTPTPAPTPAATPTPASTPSIPSTPSTPSRSGQGGTSAPTTGKGGK